MQQASGLRAAGNEAFSSGRFQDAIDEYSKAIRLLKTLQDESGSLALVSSSSTGANTTGSGNVGAPSTSAARDPDGNKDGQKQTVLEELATLHSNRSAAYASLCRKYLSRPAELSERSAMYGLEPGHLAALALKDAQQAVTARPDWPKAHARLGTALFLSERYVDAEEAYLNGLNLDPSNKALQDGLKEVSKLLQDEEQRQQQQEQAPAGAATAAEAGGGPASPTSRKRRRVAAATLDDWECSLCMRLLYEPVTTPCGHTFCRGCFIRSQDYSSRGGRCPWCRTVLHIGRDLPVTVVLANILTKSFPQEYAARAAEESEAVLAAAGTDAAGDIIPALPLFVMSTMMPGENMALNIFEPRYRLLIRRAMEGNRRIGMAQLKQEDHTLSPIAVEAEIVECITQPDGRYHVELVGRRRVEVLDAHEVDGYRVARGRLVTDTPPASEREKEVLQTIGTGLASKTDTALEYLRGWVARTDGGLGMRAARARMEALLDQLAPRPPAENYEAFSFWVANVCSLAMPQLSEPEARAHMLSLRSTHARFMYISDHLAGLPEPREWAGNCRVM